MNYYCVSLSIIYNIYLENKCIQIKVLGEALRQCNFLLFIKYKRNNNQITLN